MTARASCAPASPAPRTAPASCKPGSGTAGSGAGKLKAGLGQARAGALKISGGLHDALIGATALKKGSAAALAGSEKLAGGLGQAAKPVREGLPVFKQLAADVNTASTTVTAASGAAASTTGQIDAALAQLRSMTTAKSDPRYAQTRERADRCAHERRRGAVRARRRTSRSCPAPPASRTSRPSRWASCPLG